MLLSCLLQCGIRRQNQHLGRCHGIDRCCTLQVLLLLAEHLAQWATSPAFPEMSHLVLLQLRKVVALKMMCKTVHMPLYALLVIVIFVRPLVLVSCGTDSDSHGRWPRIPRWSALGRWPRA